MISIKYNSNIKTVLTYIILIFLLSGCVKNNSPIDNTTDRQDQVIQNFKNILINAPNGWHMVYFPQIDNNLNTDITENIKTSTNSLTPQLLSKRLGAGGYNLFLKFKDDGTVSMLTDISYKSTDDDNTKNINETYYNTSYNTEIEDCNYEIKISEDLNLIFSTQTMLDNLLALNINAKKRFSPVSYDSEKIVLRTSGYLDNSSELIVLTKNNFPMDQWKIEMNKLINRKENFRKRSFENTNNKENRICVLQIELTETGQIVYRSTSEYGYVIMDSRISKPYNHNDEIGKRVSEYDRKQYELFYRNEQPERTVDGYDGSNYYTALGSGYISTENGIYFYPGFKFNNDIIFRDFVEKAGKEWVSTVGPYTAKIKFVEKN